MTSEKHKKARVCANCACFHPHGDNMGLCRAQPPRLSLESHTAAWPIVGPNDWCVEGYKAALVPRRESQQSSQ